jgi:hypothetical protein
MVAHTPRRIERANFSGWHTTVTKRENAPPPPSPIRGIATSFHRPEMADNANPERSHTKRNWMPPGCAAEVRFVINSVINVEEWTEI